MAIKPKIKVVTNSSVDILNALRNGLSVDYKKYVPVATADAESIKAIGNVLMDYPAIRNSYINSLVNRIAYVTITSKLYENHFANFKKGMFETGETIEEVFVDLVNVYQYDPEVAEQELWKRALPNVRAAFHVMNYQKFYKLTIQRNDLRQAFTSIGAVDSFIANLTEQIYTSAAYDEEQVFKYMTAKRILDGFNHPETIPAVTKGNMGDIITVIKTVSNDMEFKKTKYNLAGVRNEAKKANQYLIVSNKFDSLSDVEVLAKAFNMEKVEFLGHRVLIDGFGELDLERLAMIFDGDSNYTEFSQEELDALNEIPALLVDGSYYQIYDYIREFTEGYNFQGLNWQYLYHVWMTWSISPFANNALFVPGTPLVTGVTVSPAAVGAGAGQAVQLSATVETDNFAPQTINWTSDSDYATVTAAGHVVISKDAPSQTVIEITATAEYPNSDGEHETGTCTITVS